MAPHHMLVEPTRSYQSLWLKSCVTSQAAQGEYIAICSDQTLRIKDNFTLADPVVHAQIGGKAKDTVVQLINRKANGTMRIRYKGTAMNIPVMPEIAAKLKVHMKEKPKLDLSKLLLSPMPGVVKSVSVEVGQMVGEGQECCVVEAMKMQNSMKAGGTGKVKSVNVKMGDTVEEEDVLIELE